jgi:RNA polymerase sigma-54 factor
METRARIGVTQTQRLSLNSGLQAALRLLKMDAAALTRYLEEQAAENPALVLRPAFPSAGDWLPRWAGTLPFSGVDETASLAAHGPSLMAHVLDAIPRLVSAERDRRIAIALAEALEPTGWLGRPVAAIAAESGCSEEQVEAVLVAMQKIDPPGLFARNLTECLRLQALDAEALDPVLTVMLGRLDLLASGDWAALSRLAGVPEAEIHSRFRLIRSFNPKPGTAFAAISSPQREPDLLVRQGEQGWEVNLNRSALPALSVDAQTEGAAQARDLLRQVENRNMTLLSVAQAILSHQRVALDNGPTALKPLTMQALAQSLGLHKSTISRVVAGASVDTPHGTWWLRALFSSDMGADTGAAALRARLAQLVSEEDAANPLSDDALARMLSSEGVTLARRTVAKYRAELRIPNASRRRQTARAS